MGSGLESIPLITQSRGLTEKRMIQRARRYEGTGLRLFIVVPMADYSANNKTVSDKIREGNDRPYTSYVIVVRFGFVIGKTP